MDIDGFWRLVERSGRARDTLAGREDWLVSVLSRLDRTHIEDFEMRLQECRDRIDNAAVWGAADVLLDGCSTDGFWYFQCWLIGQGREAFERVAADPDALATLPSVHRLTRPRRDWADEEWPWWEALAYVARAAYPGDDEVFDEALERRGFWIRCDPRTPDWSRPRSYPRLAGLFGRVSGGPG
ncbi:hypothetical protein BJY16_008038 [Actinoplanes octamycinicus]|uniref:DUF4240 domain-containing protein n=1 Tax=Actinoplanes octamycinicus TaxID=135948 RepID=A0A7W7H634_9ACTN|nr:DUF4240 domain-containing protein [Actinoplanes octamycinicus]MBB4744579.1 hypothetical protein [Actinoplanes octamycinicus]GIE63768.1 hypothetical protein Aoc01nite_91700 [Actinoplanes octamycinicus]